MLLQCCDGKVLWPIVGPDAVHMVNDFVFSKRSPKHLLHDYAMLEFIVLGTNVDKDVTTRDMSSAFPRSIGGPAPSGVAIFPNRNPSVPEPHINGVTCDADTLSDSRDADSGFIQFNSRLWRLACVAFPFVSASDPCGPQSVYNRWLSASEMLGYFVRSLSRLIHPNNVCRADVRLVHDTKSIS